MYLNFKRTRRVVFDQLSDCVRNNRICSVCGRMWKLLYVCLRSIRVMVGVKILSITQGRKCDFLVQVSPDKNRIVRNFRYLWGRTLRWKTYPNLVTPNTFLTRNDRRFCKQTRLNFQKNRNIIISLGKQTCVFRISS